MVSYFVIVGLGRDFFLWVCFSVGSEEMLKGVIGFFVLDCFGVLGLLLGILLYEDGFIIFFGFRFLIYSEGIIFWLMT